MNAGLTCDELVLVKDLLVKANFHQLVVIKAEVVSEELRRGLFVNRDSEEMF